VSYSDEVWPALATARKAGRDWAIFYETKSNLRRKQIAALAAAGVTNVQPGIESLSTPSLKLMDKGATALQQIAFIKWARAYNIDITYGIISGMPGETPGDLRKMVEKAGKLTHLQPPVDVTRLVLHRFSPHFSNPAGYGLEDVRPFATQRAIYRGPDERLMRLCYQLDFTVANQGEEFEDARDELVAAVERWKKAFNAGATLSMTSHQREHVIVRISAEASLEIEVISDPVESLVLESCAEVTSFGRIAHVSGTPADAIAAAAARLESRGLLLAERGSAVSLPVPAEQDVLAGGGPRRPAERDHASVS
jgi:hypothetical protein